MDKSMSEYRMMQTDATQRREAVVDGECMLQMLGLWIPDLYGRCILDIGAEPCHLGYLARERGISVVSLDNERSDWERSFKTEVPYVKGSALRLPFADESFDLVLSRYAPPTVCAQSLLEVRQSIFEALRVLRKSGQFRFTPSLLHGKFDQALHMPKAMKSAIVKQYSRDICHRISNVSHKLLRQIVPSITICEEEGADFCVVQKI